MNLFRTKKDENKIVESITTNEFVDKSDEILLNKLRNNLSELKKLKPNNPCLRHTLNNFFLKHGYDRIPNHMRLFEEFFGVIDRDYRQDFSLSQNCKVEELDCVIEILTTYRNEVAEKYEIMRKESELKKEIIDIKKALNIE